MKDLIVSLLRNLISLLLHKKVDTFLESAQKHSRYYNVETMLSKLVAGGKYHMRTGNESTNLLQKFCCSNVSKSIDCSQIMGIGAPGY